MTKPLLKLATTFVASAALAGCATTGTSRYVPSAQELAAARAVAEVSSYCDEDVDRCTQQQRSALTTLLTKEYARPVANSAAEATLRRAALHENIRRILRSPGTAGPQPD